MTDNEKITKAQEYDKICALDENGNIPTDAMVQLALRLDKMKEQMKEIKEEVNKQEELGKQLIITIMQFIIYVNEYCKKQSPEKSEELSKKIVDIFEKAEKNKAVQTATNK